MTTRCPTCRGTAVKDGNKLFPFCSSRCHMINLGRWLAEDYKIPGDPATDPPDGGPRDPESER